MSKSSVTLFTDANKTHGGNIGASKSFGHKRKENLFINSFVGTKSAGVSYVTSNIRNSNDIQGELIGTKVSSDAAIEGSGMLIVSDSITGKNVLTRRGDFRTNEKGYWVNGAGHYVKGWELDDSENLPQNFTALSSLKSVNFANKKGSPKATTFLSISGNLQETQQALTGAGVVASMKRSGLNAQTAIVKAQNTDILIPEQLASVGGITIGDQFTFTSTNKNEPKTLVYGGIAIANRQSDTMPIFSAKNTTTKFTFGNANANTQVPANAELKIAVTGGQTYSFSAVTGTPDANRKQFNSIETLKNAINSVSGLQARIVDGRLYIAPMDASKGLTFTNGNNGLFVEKLGLMDVPASPVADNVYRFNSLKTLETAINDNTERFSLKALIENGDIKITSLVATDDFKMKGTSLGRNAFSKMYVGDGTQKGRAKVTIPAANANDQLRVGDFVRISSTAGIYPPAVAKLPDGIYKVEAVDENGFSIYMVDRTVATVPAVGAANTGFTATGAGAVWQKVPGQDIPQVPAAAQVPTAITNAVNVVTFTLNAHGLVAGDRVYISGVGGYRNGGANVYIPDGYYTVANIVGGNTFDITGLSVNEVALNPPFAAVNPANWSFKKVVDSADRGLGLTIPTFNATIMATTGGIGSNKVKLFLPQSNYTPGSYIKFTDLPANPGNVIDNITVENNKNYKITARTDNYVIFEVEGGAATTGDEVANRALYSDGALPTLPNIQIDNITRAFNYFGMDLPQDVNGEVVEQKTYDSTDFGKSLSSDTHFTSAQKVPSAMTLYDSLGEAFNLRFVFAKLSPSLWAVEIRAEENEFGNYDIENARAGDGQIPGGVGTITFDENGKFSGAQGIDNLIFTRTNGSATMNVKIDWENQLADNKSVSLSQWDRTYSDFDLPQQDGQRSGTITSLSIDEEGYVVATYDSGETKKIWQLPVAMVPDFDGLISGVGGTFEVSAQSGDILLRRAGTSGAGKILGGVLEASNSDTTDELLEVQDLSNTIRANARVVGTNSKNINTILSELQ